MISVPLVQKLRALKMNELIEILENQERVPEYVNMTFDERLEHVISNLYEVKHTLRVKAYIKEAKFRVDANMIDLIESPDRELDKKLINELALCNYIRNGKNVEISGLTGCGKTYLACLLGKFACKNLYRVKYIRLPDLFDLFELVKDDVSRRCKLLTKFSNYDLLIIDEFLKDVPTTHQINILFEIIERRYNNKSNIFCSQYSSTDWYARLSESVNSEALLDRIFHGTIKLNCGAVNMRQYLAKNTTEFK